MDADECHFQEPFSYYRGKESMFDSPWIDEIFTPLDQPIEQTPEAEISDETTSQSLTSTLSRDPDDRAMYVHSTLEGCSLPMEVNSFGRLLVI